MRVAGLSIALMAAVGCDFAYTKCVDTLGDEVCGGTFEPHLGEWEGEPEAWSDGCGADVFPRDNDWLLAAQSLTPPDGATGAACTRTDRTLVCDAVSVDVTVPGEEDAEDTVTTVSITSDGDFVSQSELVGTVAVSTDTCTDDADLHLYAAWRDSWANPSPEPQGWFGEWFQNWLPGDGPGYVPGSCPQDWDEHEWSSCTSDEMLNITIVNNSTDYVALFQGGVSYGGIEAGASIPYEVCPNSPWVLSSGGFEVENCLWSFVATEEGEIITYPDDVDD